MCVWHKISVILLEERINEYSTMYFLNSYFSVSSKGETSILKIEVCIASHILQIKWREICNHLGFSLTAQKKNDLQTAACFLGNRPHFYGSLRYTEIKEHIMADTLSKCLTWAQWKLP